MNLLVGFFESIGEEPVAKEGFFHEILPVLRILLGESLMVPVL